MLALLSPIVFVLVLLCLEVSAMKKMLKVSSIALSLFANWGIAHATTIDFESLYPYGGNMTALYQEDGYTLTNNAAAVFNNQSVTDASFAWWAINYVNGYAGSMGLFANYWPLAVTLTKDDNTLFDMYSIDLSRAGTFAVWGAAGSVYFTGIKSDDTTVTQTFSYSDALAFQTFLFDGDFVGLKSVSWIAASQTTDTQYFQFDNITMYPLDSSNQIVEPASLALLGLGLAGLGFSRRKQ